MPRDANSSRSTSKAPSLIRYEARWAAAALCRDLGDMLETREDLAASLDVIERLADGAVAPWTQEVIDAVQIIRAGFVALDQAVGQAREWATS